MSQAFSSFYSSPLGAFVQSPLLARATGPNTPTPTSTEYVGVGATNTGFGVISSPRTPLSGWVARSTPVGPGIMHRVVWSDTAQLYCATYSTGSSQSQSIMTSPDGINWTFQNAAAKGLYCICWSDALTLFVAMTGGNTGSNQILTSPDGINWTAQVSAGVSSADWNDVCYSPPLGLFVAVGRSQNFKQVQTSPDGVHWTIQTTPDPADIWFTVCWSTSLGVFVACTGNAGTNQFWISSDGKTWVAATTPAGAGGGWNRICYREPSTAGDGLFVAVAFNQFATSSNGIIWTLKTPPVNLNNLTWTDIIWSHNVGYFILTAGNESTVDIPPYFILVSEDGITFNTGVQIPAGYIYGLAAKF